ncbi:MAG TPA: thiamine pyrophosphate-binding protein [Bauldia sp.]|nr:thiamine pyrophosphate-binding protein [Bauldia sp.]
MTETIGGCLIRRLIEEGVGHVFGVPGDYVLTFFNQLEKSPIQVVNTSDEQGAGFAADAYARVKGLGAVCITYCVGGLKVANAVAQAYAEKSPVVVISGAPGTREQHRDALLHHKVRGFDTQLRVFEQLTVGCALLDNPETAASEIDRVLALARRLSRPVYLELPRDMADAPVVAAPRREVPTEESDSDALAAALDEAASAIAQSRHPVIIAGEELHRFHLDDKLIAFAHKTGIPVATTIMGKSVFPEVDPLYLGVYEGAMGRESVRDYVERSDCTIMLGAMMTDMNLGIYTARIDRRHAVYAARDRVAVGFHAYDDVHMEDFIAGLAARDWVKRDCPPYEHPRRPEQRPATDAPMSVEALFRQVNAFLEADDVVIADPGDALFGAADLYIEHGVRFLGPAYYCSLGFAVPAVLGVSSALPALRPVVLVGDGAFQMSGMELGTIARYRMNPIIILLDNAGYGTERPMLDGAFNDIHPWAYWRIPEVLGTGLGMRVETERDMEEALSRARANRDAYTLIQVILPRDDHSPALRRLTASLAERVHRGKA